MPKIRYFCTIINKNYRLLSERRSAIDYGLIKYGRNQQNVQSERDRRQMV